LFSPPESSLSFQKLIFLTAIAFFHVSLSCQGAVVSQIDFITSLYMTVEKKAGLFFCQ